MPVHLQNVVPWGRSFDEYVGMFSLSEAALAGTILDCAAGPASFNAELTARGGHVVSVDPIYAFCADEIRSRVASVRAPMMEQVRADLDHFVWHSIRSPEMLEKIRLTAMERFLADFPQGLAQRRYIAGQCPELPIQGQFDLALSSHFLFLYSQHLSLEFHLETIRTLRRLARQVRIFPLLELNGQPSRHLSAVQAQLGGRRVRVEYEFLRGANEMLVIA
jgi:hypothetical protein